MHQIMNKDYPLRTTWDYFINSEIINSEIINSVNITHSSPCLYCFIGKSPTLYTSDLILNH